MSLRFSIAQPTDAPLLRDLVKQYYAFDELAWDDSRIGKAVDELLRDPSQGMACIVRKTDIVIGYIVLTWCFDHEFGGRNATITDLFLTEAMRGKGLGAKLLDHVAGYCKEQGIKAIHLQVEHKNKRAHALYQKWGFRDLERIPMTVMLDSF